MSEATVNNLQSRLSAATEDEAARSAEIDRAARAAALMRDPLLVEAFNVVRKEYVDALVGSKIDDVATQRSLKIFISTVDKIRGHLERAIATGKMAERQMEQLARTKRSLRERLGWAKQTAA